MIVTPEKITLAVAGAEVTINAATLADLWIQKLLQESGAQVPRPDPFAQPPLAEGETYVGLIVSADGTKRHHTILLPGDSDPKRWKEQLAWAENIGGDLPDRVEQALMFATLKDHFKKDWYWSNTPHASASDYAWMQHFGSGDQTCLGTNDRYRARAVRRLSI